MRRCAACGVAGREQQCGRTPEWASACARAKCLFKDVPTRAGHGLLVTTCTPRGERRRRRWVGAAPSHCAPGTWPRPRPLNLCCFHRALGLSACSRRGSCQQRGADERPGVCAAHQAVAMSFSQSPQLRTNENLTGSFWTLQRMSRTVCRTSMTQVSRKCIVLTCAIRIRIVRYIYTYTHLPITRCRSVI